MQGIRNNLKMPRLSRPRGLRDPKDSMCAAWQYASTTASVHVADVTDQSYYLFAQSKVASHPEHSSSGSHYQGIAVVWPCGSSLLCL
jgi:hypothetical protein